MPMTADPTPPDRQPWYEAEPPAHTQETPPMTQTGKSRRLTKKQIQILALIWIGVVVVVRVCVFVGILIALGRSAADGGSLLSGGGNVTPTVTAQSDQPTPTLDPALVAATQAAGPTSLPQPTIPPRQDPSFGYGIQAQIHMNTDQTLDQVEQLGLAACPALSRPGTCRLHLERREPAARVAHRPRPARPGVRQSAQTHRRSHPPDRPWRDRHQWRVDPHRRQRLRAGR